MGGAESNDTAVTPQFDVPTPVQTKADVSEASFSAMSSLLAEALDAVSCSLEDDDTAGKHRATPNDLEDAIAKQRPTALAKVSSMASKKAASARGGGKTTQNKNNSTHDAAAHVIDDEGVSRFARRGTMRGGCGRGTRGCAEPRKRGFTLIPGRRMAEPSGRHGPVLRFEVFGISVGRRAAGYGGPVRPGS